MEDVDRDIIRNERDASPTRFPDPAAFEPVRHASHEIERIPTAASSSTSSSGASARHGATNGGAISRASTQADHETHPVVRHRTHTHRLQHISTVGHDDDLVRTVTSTGRRDAKKSMPTMGNGKPMPPGLPDRSDYVVEFDGPDDPLHGQNWTMKKKLLMSAILSYCSIVAVYTSSIYSTASQSIAAIYHIGLTTSTLGLSLYVLGFAVGPLIWAPLSELRGRKLPILISMFGFSVFQVGVASAANIQTIMICRFFAGIFASAPLAIVAAYFADIFNDKQRGLAIVVFAMTVFCGPLVAPFTGGFLNMNAGWRWTAWLPAFMGFAAFILCVLFIKESYPPLILVEKASELRRRTKNWGIHARQEEIEVDIRELIERNFSRPLRMLVMEPILLAITIYMSFIYGLLYLFFTAYPLVFIGVYGMNEGVAGFAFFGLLIGMILAALSMVAYQRVWLRKLAANNGVVVPEWRLPPVVVGGLCFAIGLFWFGWTGYTGHVHWIVPILSGLMSGFGILTIFIQCLNYIVDTYLMFAASAIAANTLLRSLAGAGFPLFARQMFDNLGIEWASTLLGCLALIMVPIPLLFIKFGQGLRERSKFAPTKKQAPPPLNDSDSDGVVEEKPAAPVTAVAAAPHISNTGAAAGAHIVPTKSNKTAEDMV